MWCTTECWDCEDKKCEHYVSKTELYFKNKNHEAHVKEALDKIQYIIDYGFDYDGFNTVESLKGLIDMMVDYAKDARSILKNDTDLEGNSKNV